LSSRTRFDLNWILVILLTVLAVAPLFYPGFFEAQSGFLPTFNVTHLAEAPHWGRLADPPRSEGKLPYLLAWPFLQISGSGVTAIKWGYGLAFVLGALGVYAWTGPWLGKKGGLLAAVVYTYLPWHLSSVYVRGAYAEAWLWAWWPFLLCAADRLAERRPAARLAAVAIGLSLLAATFWTQAGLALLFAPLLAAYAVLVLDRRPRSAIHASGMLASLLLLLWLAARWLPKTSASFAGQFVYPFQLLSAAWGEGLHFQLGVAAVGLSIVAVALWFSSKERGPETDDPPSELRTHRGITTQIFWFWAGALALLVSLLLPFSSFFWSASGLDVFLTHPWQLLALVGLPLAFVAGSVIRLDGRLGELPAWAGLVALAVLASYPYLAPRFTQVDPGAQPTALIQPVGAEAPQIMILDYAISAPTEITPTLNLTLTWQAVAPVPDDYTVFVHILAPEDKIAQRDSRPCDGECPTPGWQPGEIVVDRHRLHLPLDAPPGPYRLAVGLYLLDSGERAAVVGGDDGMVILDVP